MPEIYIYLSKINTMLSQKYIDFFLKYVSDKTRDQFNNFRFIEDSLRSLYGEVIIRYVVSNQFSIDNDQIIIERDKYGKPYIQNLPIHFNISHSGIWVACVFSSQKVGIDIEQVKELPLDVAKRFFSKEEYIYLMKKDKAERIESFYDLWTLKESYIKWLGFGLSIPLDSFSLDITNTTISVRDKNRNIVPFFRQYVVEGYKLSVCATTPDFPERFNILNLEKVSVRH